MGMKIALVGYNPGKIGGIEAFSRNIKKEIFPEAEFVYEYDEAGVFKVDDCVAAAKFNRINRVFNRLSNGWFTKNKIKKILKDKKYDLIILNSPKYLDISPDLNKTILIQHTTVDNWWKSKYNFNRSNKLVDLARKVAKIVALSEMEGEVISNFFNIDHERIKIINFAAGIPFLMTEKASGKNLVMLARFQNEIKRIDLVIDAMDGLPDYTLNVYGDGKDREYLVDLARKRSNVNINSSITDKVKILDESSIYVLSSEFEGYPVSVIEAISRKLPVVARNTFYSAPDLIKDNGVLLGKTWNKKEFCDAIRYCYNNYAKCSGNAEKYFEKYDLKNVRAKWNSLIQEFNDVE